MGRSKHPLELKLHILQLFEEGNYSINELCERFSLNPQTLYSWKMKYEASGRDGLHEATSCKFYSKELKLAAVEDYIQRNYSQMEVLAKYEISST
ncbi:transposase [Lysinibacillus sphaericus]|uniref:Transposase n=1 Tax=Lysinibacillus sphaericus TaxID=1421 RepID=A0A544U7K2_LYSSH|nr:helix-turn-helix domain-containing protein [Lysinibacillus sp. SDF0037]TQR26822.1 transposase [Lysinibacillus sp. SDF0037]TQR27175.1 transposase [Lysinibacillus sp. SDF0037]TQR28769.1 transposase [Lysinibacillus sp. SDF0037]